MIHPADYEAMNAMFRGAELPRDLCDEYEMQKRMASAFGHSGALGLWLIVPMMRRLGYGRVSDQKSKTNVDWRRHIGDKVVAQYGNREVNGEVVGLGDNGYLVVKVPEYGEVELPRYCVQLPDKKRLDMEQGALGHDEWMKVRRGTKVVLQTEDGPVEAKLVASTGQGVKVTVDGDEAIYPYEAVELSA